MSRGLVTFIGDNRRARRSKKHIGYSRSIRRSGLGPSRTKPKSAAALAHKSRRGCARSFFRLGCARIIRNRSSGICGRIALTGSRLHRKLHLIHRCAAKNGCERRVRSISALSNAHEARLWSKASRVEQDPAPPKKSFDIGVKVRWIETVGICAHESSWDSQ